VVKFYLDSIQVDAPANWEDFTLKLSRDKSIDALLLTTDTTLEWIGTGYQYLSQLLDTSGFCGSVELTVTDDEPVATDVYLGRIFLSTCEINEAICSIKTKVEDRSFYAMVNNNKAIEADLTAGVSKGGVAITPVTDYVIDMHRVVGNSFKKQVYTVRVWDAFRYLIAFMTDNTVQFVSDTFNVGGDWEGLTISSGLKLRTGDIDNSPPLTLFSFKELYEEVKKKIPIGMTVTESAGVYTLRIESIDYFNQSTGSFRFENIEGITTKFNEDKLYASIKVGSTNVDPSQSFPETQPIIGYIEEQLWNDITCNIDNELDLVSSWVISSNVIEDCVSNSSAVYDEDLFLITTTLTNPTTGVATATDIFNSGTDFFYNDLLRNINVLYRYTNGIPSSALANFNGTPSNFYAFKTTTETTTRTVTITGAGVVTHNAATGALVTRFDDDSTPPGNDPNGVYIANMGVPVAAANTFTAPTDAFYNFEVFADFTITGIPSGTITAIGLERLTVNTLTNANAIAVRLEYDTFDSGGGSIDNNIPVGTGWGGRYSKTYSENNTTHSPYIYTTASQPFFFSKYLRAGDILSLQMIANFANIYQTTIAGGGVGGTLTITESIRLNQGSYFRCIGNSTDNPNLQIGNINEYIAYEHSFEYPMTATEFTYLKDNSRDLIEFSMFGRSPRYGWVSDLKYNWIKGTASVKLESNAINNNVT